MRTIRDELVTVTVSQWRGGKQDAARFVDVLAHRGFVAQWAEAQSLECIAITTPAGVLCALPGNWIGVRETGEGAPVPVILLAAG